MTVEYVCPAYLKQCMRVQVARRESAESSKRARGLEEQLAELRQRLSLSAQAESAARLETSKACLLPSYSLSLVPCTPAATGKNHTSLAQIGQHCFFRPADNKHQSQEASPSHAAGRWEQLEGVQTGASAHGMESPCTSMCER